MLLCKESDLRLRNEHMFQYVSLFTNPEMRLAQTNAYVWWRMRKGNCCGSHIAYGHYSFIRVIKKSCFFSLSFVLLVSLIFWPSVCYAFVQLLKLHHISTKWWKIGREIIRNWWAGHCNCGSEVTCPLCCTLSLYHVVPVFHVRFTWSNLIHLTWACVEHCCYDNNSPGISE